MRVFILTIFVMIAVVLAAAQGEKAKCSPIGKAVSILHLHIFEEKKLNVSCVLFV